MCCINFGKRLLWFSLTFAIGFYSSNLSDFDKNKITQVSLNSAAEFSTERNIMQSGNLFDVADSVDCQNQDFKANFTKIPKKLDRKFGDLELSVSLEKLKKQLNASMEQMKSNHNLLYVENCVK